MTTQIISNTIFTKELLLSVGCEDTDDTDRMVGVLNAFSHLWGQEIKFYMEKIINKVKSETDQLSRVLAGSQSDSGNKDGQPSKTKEGGPSSRNLKESDQRVSKLQEEVKTLQQTQKNLKERDTALTGLLQSYNAKCIDFDLIRDEAGRQATWSNETIRNLKTWKTELELSIKRMRDENLELKGKLSAEDKTTEEGKRQQKIKMLQELQSFIDPTDKRAAVCPVPTNQGCLVSLKHIYNSWKQNGVKPLMNGAYFPGFVMSDSSTIIELASPSQITLIHKISHELGAPVDPPFKIQYKQGEDDSAWMDIALADQIKIASVMYHMKENQRDGTKVEYLFVENNSLLVQIVLEQQCFKYNVKETIHEEPRDIQSRMIVSDSSCEMFS